MFKKIEKHNLNSAKLFIFGEYLMKLSSFFDSFFRRTIESWTEKKLQWLWYWNSRFNVISLTGKPKILVEWRTNGTWYEIAKVIRMKIVNNGTILSMTSIWFRIEYPFHTDFCIRLLSIHVENGNKNSKQWEKESE